MAQKPMDSNADENYEKSDLKGDRLNFILLTTLYTLQGAVGGIVLAVPKVLQKRNIAYEDQVSLIDKFFFK